MPETLSKADGKLVVTKTTVKVEKYTKEQIEKALANLEASLVKWKARLTEINKK